MKFQVIWNRQNKNHWLFQSTSISMSKGIGLVAIGYVQSGSVSVHDELHLLPAEGPGTVKSLQVMDDDVSKQLPEIELELPCAIPRKSTSRVVL